MRLGLQALRDIKLQGDERQREVGAKKVVFVAKSRVKRRVLNLSVAK